MKEFLRRFRSVPRGWYLPPAVAFLWNQAVYYDMDTAISRALELAAKE